MLMSCRPALRRRSAPEPHAIAPRERRSGYQPALDGVRALAVAAVLAYHAGFSWARGGFLGVDAFFVLSGYLITALLLDERRSAGGIDVRRFWARRARRLVPALFLLVTAVLAYAAVFADPNEVQGIRTDSIATLAYVANWREIFGGGSYFAQFTAPSPLLHTWSLAIEEQWYVFWPLVVALLMRAGRGSTLLLVAVSLMLAVASALLMAYLRSPGADPSRVYYGTDTRAQSLLVGAMLACLLSSGVSVRVARLFRLVAPFCVAFVGWMWVSMTYDSLLLYRGGFGLLALAVAVIIGAAVTAPRSPIAGILSCAPLRRLGVISYGVYLFHWPVYLVLTPDRTGWSDYPLFGARVLVTLAVAIASYQLLERPIRDGALVRPRVSIAAMISAAAALLAIAFVVVRWAGPAPTSASVPAAGSVSNEAPAAASASTTRVLVIGDSVAFTLAQGLGTTGGEQKLAVWNQGQLGCGVLDGEPIAGGGAGDGQPTFCDGRRERWRSYVDAFDPDAVVLMGGAWDLYDRTVSGKTLAFDSPESQAFAADQLRQAVDLLSSKGATVILLTTPYFRQPDRGLASDGPRFDRRRIDAWNELLRSLQQESSAPAVIADLNVGLTTDDAMADRSISPDGVHFTPHGADVVAAWLRPQILAAARHRSNPTGGGSTEVRAATQPSRWTEMLAQFPDSASAEKGTFANDYARFRSIFGFDTPGVNASADQLFKYYRRLMFDADGNRSGLNPAPLTGIAQMPPLLDQLRQSDGYSIADIDRDAWTEGSGGDQIAAGPIAVIGARSSAGVDRAFVTGNGEYLRVRSANAASKDEPVQSLADDVDLRALAEKLDELDTYTALFSKDAGAYALAPISARVAGPDATSADRASAATALATQTRLLQFRALATGAGVDERGAYTALLLVQNDPADAQANVARLQERVAQATSWLAGKPYSELVTSVEVTTDRSMLVAKLRGASNGFWFGLHAARDTLLLHD